MLLSLILSLFHYIFLPFTFLRISEDDCCFLSFYPHLSFLSCTSAFSAHIPHISSENCHQVDYVNKRKTFYAQTGKRVNRRIVRPLCLQNVQPKNWNHAASVKLTSNSAPKCYRIILSCDLALYFLHN